MKRYNHQNINALGLEMIIWSGYGLLVALAYFLGLMVYFFINGLLVTHDYFVQSDGWFMVMVFLISAGINYIFTKKLVPPSNRQVLVDKQTGKRMVFEDKSSLFFIQNKYWTFIFLAVGVVRKKGVIEYAFSWLDF